MSSSNAYAGPWSSLPTTLTPWVLNVINSLGYSSMTPVQASTIPLFMKHKDVVVEAVTGSGKTLSFVIPIIERLIRSESPLQKSEIGALVISPTRELATQIRSVFELFLKSQRSDECTNDTSHNGYRPRYAAPLLLVSSSKSSPADDINRFLKTGADIVVGTPGRVEEFILRKGRDSVSAKNLDVLVLDEADRLLDMGFSQCLTQILAALPKQRRTGLFSATMTDALSELIRVGLRNPVRIVVRVEAKKLKDGKIVREKIEERRIPASLQIFYMVCNPAEKLIQLFRVIEDERRNSAASRFIIYFATCACVDYFYRILPSFLPSTSHFSLHGHIPPSKRSLSLSSFINHPSTSQSPSILLCTDVAARGLDLPDVDCIIQFDLPVDPKQFSHRCGRTARAGKDGRAWVFLSEREEGYVDFLSVRKIPLTERTILKLGATGEEEGHSRNLEVQEMLSSIRAIVRKDRDLHDKAIKAFVSFVRAYSKHEASYIFRMQDLDLVGIAKSFGLLRLPKMPEFRGHSIEEWQDDDIDWDAFAYVNNVREVRRQALLEKTHSGEAKELRDQENKKTAVMKLKNAAWSDKAQKKVEKLKRKQKKERKRDWLKMQGQHTSASQHSGQATQGKRSASGSEDLDGDDWDELAREERMAKKVKKGALDSRTFDMEFNGLG